jgi:hypothetical protein
MLLLLLLLSAAWLAAGRMLLLQQLLLAAASVAAKCRASKCRHRLLVCAVVAGLRVEVHPVQGRCGATACGTLARNWLAVAAWCPFCDCERSIARH